MEKPDIEELVNTAVTGYAMRMKTPRWWEVCTLCTEAGRPVRLLAVPGDEPVVVVDRNRYHQALATLAALGLPELHNR